MSLIAELLLLIHLVENTAVYMKFSSHAAILGNIKTFSAGHLQLVVKYCRHTWPKSGI